MDYCKSEGLNSKRVMAIRVATGAKAKYIIERQLRSNSKGLIPYEACCAGAGFLCAKQSRHAQFRLPV
jgi:hypothetical protein